MIDQIECYVLLPPERSGREEMLRAAQDLEGQGRWEDAMRVRIEVAETWPGPDWESLRLPWQWFDYPSPRGRGHLDGGNGDKDVHVILRGARRVVWMDFSKWVRIGQMIFIGDCEYSAPMDGAFGILGYGEASVQTGQGEAAGVGLLTDGRSMAWEIAGGYLDIGIDRTFEAQIAALSVGIARTPGACLEWLTARSREIIKWG